MDGFMGDIADSTADAVAKLAPELRAQGLVLVRIPPGQAARGDFVVTRDCKLWTVDAEQAGRLILRGLGADKGASRTVSRGELECAFGVRRMG